MAYFKESQTIAVDRNLRVTINLLRNQHLPVIIWNKNHILYKFVPTKCTLVKKVFAVANFEVL